MASDSTRLFVLSELSRRVEAHGHELRREASIGRTDLWSDVRAGSVYGAIARLTQQGLIEPARSEREGNRPERTKYRLTAEGKRELSTLRDAMLRHVSALPDPFDVALEAATELAPHVLNDIIQDRVAELTLRVDKLEHLREASSRYLSATDHALFDHALIRLHADISWHQKLPATLAGDEGWNE